MSEVDGGRRRRTRREGGACLSRRLPFLGPWDEPRPLAMPGRVRRASPTRGKGVNPYKAVPHRVTPIHHKEKAGRARGAACLGADGTLSSRMTIPATLAGCDGKANAKEGEDPHEAEPRRGDRAPFQGKTGAWGHPDLSRWHPCRLWGVPEVGESQRGVGGVPCPSEYGGVKQAGGAGRVLYEGGFPAH